MFEKNLRKKYHKEFKEKSTSFVDSKGLVTEKILTLDQTIEQAIEQINNLDIPSEIKAIGIGLLFYFGSPRKMR